MDFKIEIGNLSIGVDHMSQAAGVVIVLGAAILAADTLVRLQQLRTHEFNLGVPDDNGHEANWSVLG